ncbi:MAG: hypothetical protein QOF81_216 [Acidimicrobiaceae bacterium]|jgi:type II secretory pathway pseudopilin PulG|nr:hypothetical protein [Acidimicrobiaceae bacterium]
MNPNRRPWAFPDPRRDEGGMALIASLLVMMICVILVAAAFQLATHSSQRSGLSRNRSASLHAAEAGLEAALATLASSSVCPGAGLEVPLPDQNLPSESYMVLAPVSCSPGGNAVIAAVGYVPNATRPVATTTLVAHINRGQGAPVSGTNAAGVVSCAVTTQCGYVFPDALYSGGAITAAPGVGTLSAYGTGGTVPNVVANGAINITGAQIDGLVHGWSTVNLTVSAIGGEVVGNGVSITGATVQGGLGGVVSSNTLTLTDSTVNGTAKYKGPTTNYSSANSTVTGGASPVTPAPDLGSSRLMPTYTDSALDMSSIVGVGLPASNSCPGNGVGSYYDYTPLVSLNCTYNPATIDGTVVLVVRSTLGGALTINVPQTTNGGQLYVIMTGAGILDTLNIVGSNSTLPVFAFTDGTMTLRGGITGQFVGGSIATAAPTTLTFAPPAIPAPDFAFNNTQTAPGGLGYAASIAFQYQCPGTTAC